MGVSDADEERLRKLKFDKRGTSKFGSSHNPEGDGWFYAFGFAKCEFTSSFGF